MFNKILIYVFLIQKKCPSYFLILDKNFKAAPLDNFQKNPFLSGRCSSQNRKVPALQQQQQHQHHQVRLVLPNHICLHLTGSLANTLTLREREELSQGPSSSRPVH